MKQEEYLLSIKKQQSLIRKLFASRKRRLEVVDELTMERYEHLRGKSFKADGEYFKHYKGVLYYIAAVHGETKSDDTDEMVVRLECRYIMRSAVYPGITFKSDGSQDNIAFFTEVFRFSLEDNLDQILAPLYISEEKSAKEVNEVFYEFMKNFLKKG